MFRTNRAALGASRLSRLILFLTLAVFATLPAQSQTSESGRKLYGLVVGINNYSGTDNQLAGAVADAHDIAGALRRVGANEVVKLLNADAAKDKVIQTWQRLVAQAKAGDTIIFSFAGYGGQETEPDGRNTEADGKNETFLLSGYAPQGPGTSERIVDDEIYDWLLTAERKEVKVAFVADTCHHGQLLRDVDGTQLNYRTTDFPNITEDQLAYPPLNRSAMRPQDFRHAMFIRAAGNDHCAAEISISGEKRGALSWAVARAIEGAADNDKDEILTQKELREYLVPAVSAYTEGQQIPQVLPIRRKTFELLSIEKAGILAEEGRPPTGPLKILIKNASISGLDGLSNVEAASDAHDAELTWDAASGDVYHALGGRVAQGVESSGLAFVVSKWSAIKWLKENARYLAPFHLPKGTHRYPEHSVVSIRLSGGRLPYLTMFNLPPDGKVQMFIPDDATDPAEALTDWRKRVFKEAFAVDNPPFGAEHMVAIFTEEVVRDLHKALRDMASPEAAQTLRQVLQRELQHRKFQLGLLSIYTGNSE